MKGSGSEMARGGGGRKVGGEEERENEGEGGKRQKGEHPAQPTFKKNLAITNCLVTLIQKLKGVLSLLQG